MTDELNTNTAAPENTENAQTTNAQPETAQAAAAPEFDAADIEKGKTAGGLAYILFFLPLVMCPESKYGKFHANQGLALLIVSVVGTIVLSIIPIIGWILLPLFGIAVAVFAVMGIINGLGGKAKELPLLGKIKLLK